MLLANRGLVERGYECMLVHGSLYAGEQAFPVDQYTGVGTLVDVPALRRPIDPIADVRAAFEIGRIIRQFRPHIIHTHHSKAGLIGRSVGKLASRARLLHTYHGNVASNLFGSAASRGIVTVERALGRFTDRLIAISAEQREELLRLRIAAPQRIEVVELALDLDRYRAVRGAAAKARARQQQGIPADETVMLFSGRLVAVKRLDWLLRAVAPLLAAIPQVRLVILGDGPERAHLEELARELGVDRRVHFIGWVPSVVDWLAASDLVVMPSSWEGTPLAVIEAMAVGRATVATDVGGVRDIVAEGRTGLVVDKDDRAGFASALERLIRDPELRERMAAESIATSERFGAERLVRQLDEIYQLLLQPASAA